MTNPTTIHEMAVVEGGAKLGQGVIIEPFCVIHSGAQIGDGCHIKSHSVIGGNVTLSNNVTVQHANIEGHTTIGTQTIIRPFSSVGGLSQDIKAARNGNQRLVIGKNCVIFENVTINAASEAAAQTSLGNNVHVMTGAHIGHDCTVGNHVILVNNVKLAGHVVVGNGARINADAGIQQFTRIGAHALIAAKAAVTKDVVPFALVQGNPAELRGFNRIGMERAGFDADAVRRVRTVWKALFQDNGKAFTQRVASMRDSASSNAELGTILSFIDDVGIDKVQLTMPANAVGNGYAR